MSLLPSDAITLPPCSALSNGNLTCCHHPPSLSNDDTSCLTPPPCTPSHPLLPSSALPHATLLPHHHPCQTIPTHHHTSAQHLATSLDHLPPSSTLAHSASPCLHMPASVCIHADSKSVCICMLPCMHSLSPSLPSRPHCVMRALSHPPTPPHALECMRTCSLELTLAVFLALGTSISPALPCLTPALALS